MLCRSEHAIGIHYGSKVISLGHNAFLHKKLTSTMAVASPGKLNLSQSPWGSRSLDCYKKLEKIGEGTYGQVFMAREIETGEIVAIKKIRMGKEKEGFPITAIREIKILKKLNHDNVIKLKEVITSPKDGMVYMVFEYMDHDLRGLSNRPGVWLGSAQIKCYMKQLLTGLHYCHVNQVLHRDIKDANILIDNRGNLKLADFGLARSFSNDNLTSNVVTLWYRAPELLLGARKYGPSVDMWSVGCVFAGLLHRKPILQGMTDAEQLKMIFDLCGAPDEANWPGVSKLPGYNSFKPSRPTKNRLREAFRHFGSHALNLLEKMLTLDPLKRVSVKDALHDEYFWTDPLPADPKSLPTYESSHELQINGMLQQQRQYEEAAKRRKLQHPQQYACLPPMHQSGQLQFQPRHEPNQPMPNHYENSRGESRRRDGLQPSGNGVCNATYEARRYGREFLPYTERSRCDEISLPGLAARGGDSGNRGGRNYPHGGLLGDSGGSRGATVSSINRNRHYNGQ